VFDASLVSPTKEGATFILTTDSLGFPAVQPTRPIPGPEDR
jgi:hypothetical protein